jgi:hypothetical protein
MNCLRATTSRTHMSLFMLNTIERVEIYTYKIITNIRVLDSYFKVLI